MTLFQDAAQLAEARLFETVEGVETAVERKGAPHGPPFAFQADMQAFCELPGLDSNQQPSG